MRPLGLAVAALMLGSAARAQNFSGTYNTPTDNGGQLVLTLSQNPRGVVTGSLSGNGVTFLFAGQARQGQLSGVARNGPAVLHIAGTMAQGGLDVTLSDADANGQPIASQSRRITMARVGQQAADSGQRRPGFLQRLGSAIGEAARQQQGGAGNAGPGNSAPGNTTPGNTAPAGPVATSAQDQQIVQLLTSRNWCYMRYSQAMGSTTTERVAFSADGRWAMTTGRETALNTQAGSYYGNSNGVSRGTFRVQNGVLLMSENGFQWEQYPLRIYQNSNGYPIVNANNKEYSGC